MPTRSLAHSSSLFLEHAVPHPGSTVFTTCIAKRVSTTTKVDRTHAKAGRHVTYGLQVLNEREENVCLDDLCVRIDMPPGVAYRRSRLFPPTILRNGTEPPPPISRRGRKPAGTGKVIVGENGTTSVVWSGVSLAPGRRGRFAVKMMVLSGPDRQPGPLTIQGSVRHCEDRNICVNRAPPVQVRVSRTCGYIIQAGAGPHLTPNPFSISSNAHRSSSSIKSDEG